MRALGYTIMEWLGLVRAQDAPYAKLAKIHRRRLGLAVGVGVGQFVYFWNHFTAGKAPEKWFAFSAAVAGAAVYYAAFTLVAESEARALVRDEIRRDLELAKDDIVRRLRGRYMPRDIYPYAADWDLRFNTDLTMDLQACDEYWFRGPTGRFLPVRLAHMERPQQLPVLRVVLMDPRSEATVVRGAVDRLAKAKEMGRDRQEVIEEVRRDIQGTVAALWHCRGYCRSIQIAYEASAVDVRVELFTERCAYVADTERSAEHPRQIRWDPRDDGYIHELQNFDSLLTYGSHRVAFDKGSTRDELHDHLRAIGVDDPAGEERKLIEANLNGPAADLASTLRKARIWSVSESWDRGLVAANGLYDAR